MDDWNELKLVLAVERAGSLTRAAEALRVDHSTLFRRLRALEERLGAKMFDCSGRGLSTHVGKGAGGRGR